MLVTSLNKYIKMQHQIFCCFIYDDMRRANGVIEQVHKCSIKSCCCRLYDVLLSFIWCFFFLKAEHLPRIVQLTLGFIPDLHMKEIKKSYNVQEIIIHKKICALYLLNDIAILKLTTMVEENSDVAPLCVTSLPPSDFYGTQCVVTWW